MERESTVEERSEKFILVVPPAHPPKGPGQILTLSELRRLSIRKIVRILRSKRYSRAMALCKDIEGLKRRSLIICLIMGARARKRAFADEKGQEVDISTGTFLASLGKLGLEALLSPAVLFFSFAVLWSFKLTQRR